MALATAYRTITLKGEGVMNEGLASGAITPGHLLERTNAAADTFKVHATAGGEHGAIVAVEDELQGNTITDAYASAARIFCKVFRKGDVFFGIIANGQNIAKGDTLVSNGNGELKKLTADSSGTVAEEFPVGVALDAVDLSSSSGADALVGNRCRVEVV